MRIECSLAGLAHFPRVDHESATLNTGFWLRRFVVALAAAFVVITAAQLLRGRPTEDAVTHGLVWSVITAAIYVGANYYRWRRGQRCIVCGDPPEPRGSAPADRGS